MTLIPRLQTTHGMYRRAAFPIVNALADLQFSATQVFVYNAVTHFMTHLHRSAGVFWTYHLMVCSTSMAMQPFFRAFGLVFRVFGLAFGISAIFFLHILRYDGVCQGAVGRNGVMSF